jgi:hypothetical protein
LGRAQHKKIARYNYCQGIAAHERFHLFEETQELTLLSSVKKFKIADLRDKGESVRGF